MTDLVGIFGGTFDPVHNGHLKSLSLLCDSVPLTRVHWVLSARPPHKDQTSANIEHRFEMLRRALLDYEHFVADDIEIRRHKKSYTIDTVSQFKITNPDACLCLIIGADSLLKLHTWRNYVELIEMTNWIVMHRPGYKPVTPKELQNRLVRSSDELLHSSGGKMWMFSHSDFDVSSTELRSELQNSDWQQSEYIQKYLPDPIITYIHHHQLYKQCP